MTFDERVRAMKAYNEARFKEEVAAEIEVRINLLAEQVVLGKHKAQAVVEFEPWIKNDLTYRINFFNEFDKQLTERYGNELKFESKEDGVGFYLRVNTA